MTDHELAVKMVRRGIDVFKEVNKDTFAEPNALTLTLVPVLLVSCINAAIQVHVMKQLAAALSGKDVNIP